MSLCVAAAIFAGVAVVRADDELVEEAVKETPIEDLLEIEGRQAVVVLDNGDALRGRVLDERPDVVIFNHPSLGRMSLPRERIRALRYAADPPVPGEVVPPPIVKEEPGNDARALPPEEEEAAPPKADPVPEPEPAPEAEEAKADYTFRIELGLDGSRGSTERASGRAAFSLTRSVPGHVLRFNTNYYVAEQNKRETARRWRTFARSEWTLAESRWDVFVQGETEVDEFKAYEWRLTMNSGIAYRFIEADDTKLKGRVGPGFSFTSGLPSSDDTEPFQQEFVAGMELSHKLSERQRLASYAEYLPRAGEFGDYRLKVGGSWEIRLAEDKNLVLKLGVEDRYDSRAEEDPNDLDYYAALGWTF